ncbi:hypothetical protein WA158_006670 [Blastocystis sp. Blastoise]
MIFEAGILFVCLGNICRSPLGEGIMREYVKNLHLSDMIKVYSCGTCSFHVGQAPHSGGQRCARSHGLDISDLRGSQIQKKDFEDYDLIVAMDSSNVEDINDYRRSSKGSDHAVVKMLTDYVPGRKGEDVPDAYYANDQKACFEEIYQMITIACPNIMKDLLKMIKEKDSDLFERMKNQTSNKALPLFLKALCYSVENGFLRYEAICHTYLGMFDQDLRYICIGILYSLRKTYDRAYESFEKAISIFSLLNLTDEKHLAMSYAAPTYVYMGIYTKIVESLRWRSQYGKSLSIRNKATIDYHHYMKELLEYDDHIFAHEEAMKEIFEGYQNNNKFGFLDESWQEYDITSFPLNRIQKDCEDGYKQLNDFRVLISNIEKQQDLYIHQLIKTKDSLPKTKEQSLLGLSLSHVEKSICNKIVYYEQCKLIFHKIYIRLPLFIEFYYYKLKNLIKICRKNEEIINSVNNKLTRKVNDIIQTSELIFEDKQPSKDSISPSLALLMKQDPAVIKETALSLESRVSIYMNIQHSYLNSLQKWYMLLEKEKDLIFMQVIQTLKKMDETYISVLTDSLSEMTQGSVILSGDSRIRLDIHNQIVDSILKEGEWDLKKEPEQTQIPNIAWYDPRIDTEEVKYNIHLNNSIHLQSSLYIPETSDVRINNDDLSDSEEETDIDIYTTINKEIQNTYSNTASCSSLAETVSDDFSDTLSETISESCSLCDSLYQNDIDIHLISNEYNSKDLHITAEIEKSNEYQQMNFYKNNNVSGSLYLLTTNREGRNILIQALTDLRGKGKSIGSHYPIFIHIFKLLLDEIYRSKDIKQGKNIMILSQSYFYYLNGEKHEISDDLSDHPIWQDYGFWEEFLLSSIREELLRYVQIHLDESGQQYKHQIILSQLNTCIFNMKQFKCDKNNTILFIKRMGYAHSVSQENIQNLITICQED